jgi:hypothetical protein
MTDTSIEHARHDPLRDPKKKPPPGSRAPGGRLTNKDGSVACNAQRWALYRLDEATAVPIAAADKSLIQRTPNAVWRRLAPRLPCFSAAPAADAPILSGSAIGSSSSAAGSSPSRGVTLRLRYQM